MPGRDSARAKLIHSGQSPLAHIERMKSLPRKKDVQEGRGRGVRGKEAKSKLPHTRMCVGFKKFSQMILSRLTHFVTLSLKLERRGTPPHTPTPFNSPDYTPLSPCSLGVRSEPWGCRLLPPLAQPPLVTCKVCCFSP